MAKLFMILIVIFVAFLQLIACQELATESDESTKSELNKDGSAAPHGVVPIVLLRGKDDKPDFFLFWWKPYEPLIPKPMMDMINSQVRPQTEQMSGQIIDNVPGADQVWSQMSQVQNIINQLGFANMLGAGSSNSDNPLSSMFGRRRH